MQSQPIWTLILAAGDGRRLQSLTTQGGIAVPKQFCSLSGGPSLLQDSVRRAKQLVPAQNVCAVVSAHHRQWWENPLSMLLAENIIVQPSNRGTAYGVLLPLLHIAKVAPNAVVLLMPADHYFQNESPLAHSMRAAVERATSHPREIVLLGMQPDRADSELGYVVPSETNTDVAASVARFVEKPPLDAARSLIARGALWNSFILAGTVDALLELYANRPSLAVREIREVIGQAWSQRNIPARLAALYRELAPADFSRDLLEGQESRLTVMRVPQCGWTDLGTPSRVAEVVSKLALQVLPVAQPQRDPTVINLADRHLWAVAQTRVNQSSAVAHGGRQ